MYIINVLVLTVLILFSSVDGYVVPVCLENGDVCAERIVLALPGFSFNTQFCLTSETEESVVSHMFCTVCDSVGRVVDMISSSVRCILEEEQPPKAETYFEIVIEFLGLEHLIQRKKKRSCVEELLAEHYMTAVYSVLFLTSVVMYFAFFLKRSKTNGTETDQLAFINKFQKGDFGEDGFKDELSSINDQEDGII